MITIRKLASLKRNTALRKTAALLQGFEADLIAGRDIDIFYLKELVVKIIAPADSGLAHRSQTSLSELIYLERSGQSRPQDTRQLRRVCNNLRHLLYSFLDTRPADWDLMPPADSIAAGSGARRVLPFTVYLEDLRSPFNVGSIFRSAESFCVKQIILSPSCPRPDLPRSSRSAMGSDKVVPWSIGDLETLDQEHVFALETGGTPLEKFCFPEDGAVIVGNEELGVTPQARDLVSKGAGIVSIPLYGVKGSLNVTAAFAILIHSWSSRVLSSLPS